MALEEEFETGIPDEEAEKITTVQLAIGYKRAPLNRHTRLPVTTLDRSGVAFLYLATEEYSELSQ